MEKTMEDFAAFERAMDEDGLFRRFDFHGICSEIGADPARLDEMLWKELGFTGQSLVDFYRTRLDIP